MLRPPFLSAASGRSSTHRQGQGHAGDRAGQRFLRRREVGVRIDVHQADIALDPTCRAQQRPEDDAAIAAEQHHKMFVVACGLHAIREHSAVFEDLGLVAGPARRTHIVAIGRRMDIAKIVRAQPRDETELPEDVRRLIEVPYLT